MAAAAIAGGLVSVHGVDHGGVDADTIALRALTIADAIIANAEPVPAPESVDETPQGSD